MFDVLVNIIGLELSFFYLFLICFIRLLLTNVFFLEVLGLIKSLAKIKISDAVELEGWLNS